MIQIKHSVKKQTIEIDDSGTGDLVGDAFIGFHVLETGKIIFRSVPVGLYNKKNHEERKSKEYILKMVRDGLKTLKFNKDIDSIRICRGNCFDLVRDWFDKEEIEHKPTIVEGKLQEAVEGRLISHLRKLGVKSKKLTKEAGAQRYFILFNWVSRNFPEHERYVKSGFPAWNKKWRDIAIERYQRYC